MCGRGKHACTSSLLFSAGDILGLHKRPSESIAKSAYRYSPLSVRFFNTFEFSSVQAYFLIEKSTVGPRRIVMIIKRYTGEM